MNITIEPGASALLDALHRAGFAAYAVGGCVRDSLLGRMPEDWDVTTSALPEAARSPAGCGAGEKASAKHSTSRAQLIPGAP